MEISLKPLRCGDPALPTLYGYPKSAIFRYAEKTRMHMPRLLVEGMDPLGHAVRAEGLHFSAFHFVLVCLCSMDVWVWVSFLSSFPL